MTIKLKRSFLKGRLNEAMVAGAGNLKEGLIRENLVSFMPEVLNA